MEFQGHFLACLAKPVLPARADTSRQQPQVGCIAMHLKYLAEVLVISSDA